MKLKKKKDRLPWPQRIVYLISAICILASGYGFSTMQSESRLFDQKYRDNEVAIRQKQGTLEMLQAYEPENTEYVSSNMMSAAKAGDAIANFQMAYWKADASIGDELRVIKSQIQEYMALGAKGSELWFGPGILWPDEFTWRFESNYDFAGNTIPVVWTCWDLKDRLVCYASSEYDAQNNVFSDITVSETSYGRMYGGVDDIVTRPEDFESLDLEGLQDAIGIDAEALQNGDVEKGFGIKLKEGFNEDGSLWDGWEIGDDGEPRPIPGYGDNGSDESINTGTLGDDGTGYQESDADQDADVSDRQPDTTQEPQDGFTWEGGGVNE